MTQATQNSDAWVHYEFSTIKCYKCGIESNGFVHKDHLEADDMIKYVQEITGFTLHSTGETRSMGLTSRSAGEGGLMCHLCKKELTKKLRLKKLKEKK